MNKTIIFLATLLASLPALAGPFDPTAGDASMKLLGEVLQGLLPGSSGESPIAGMLRVFNSAILLAAGCVVAYTTFAGTMQTAHDGEMMGKRWSSMWVPLRTALGIALIVPVKGFCLAQLAVVWLAVQGIGVADAAWSSFATSSLAKDDMMVQPHSPRVEAFAAQALSALVCVEAINRTIAQTPSAAALGATPASVSSSNETIGDVAFTFGLVGDKIVKRELINFGGGAIDKAGCGQIAFENKTTGGDGVKVLAEGGKGLFDVRWVGLKKNLVPPTATEAAHRQAVAALLSGLSPLAKAIVDADENGWAAADGQKSALTNSIKAYRQAVVSAAMGEASANGLDGMAEAMSQDGWMLAGAWYLGIVKTQNDINSAIESVPQIQAGKPDDSMFADALNRSQVRLESFLKSSGGQRYAISGYAKTSGASPTAPNEGAASLMNLVVRSLSDIDLSGLASDPRSPLIVAKEIGDNLIGWAAAGLAALVGVSIVAGPFGSLVGPFLSALMFAGVAAGVLLAFYTPFIPFFVWMGAVIGWLILLCEAIVAAPLVAFAKLDPNGEGLLGSSKPGYILLLSLVLRPVLMVFGMVLSIMLLGPLGRFINATVLDILAVSRGGGFGWIISTIGGVFIYAALLMAMLHGLFSLIHIIPDRIIRWIGGHDAHAGGHSADTEQRGKTVVGGVGSSSQNAASQAANSTPRAMERADRDKERAARMETMEAKTQSKNNPTTGGKK